LPKLSRRQRTRLTLTITAVLLIDLAWTCAPVRAEVRSNGPVVAVGFSEKLRNDMVLPTLGWRWQLRAGDTIEGWGKKIGADFSFVVEPSVAAIVGDKNSFEMQVVPFLHVEPESENERRWAPFFEAGIGIIYTAVEGLHLGSNVLFSDDVGVGIRFTIPSYRNVERPRHRLSLSPHLACRHFRRRELRHEHSLSDPLASIAHNTLAPPLAEHFISRVVAVIIVACGRSGRFRCGNR
jgi:hypothetical protein